MWDGEVDTDWKKTEHKPEWVSWHDFQAACMWFACKKCEEKFFLTDEYLDNLHYSAQPFLESIVNQRHADRIKLVQKAE